MTADFLSSTYHLSRIPFELGRFDVPRVGRELEWRRLNQLLAETQQQGRARIVVLLGTYGVGKSFLMWQLHREAQKKNAKWLVSRPVRMLDPENSRDFVRNLVLRTLKRGFDLDMELRPIARAAIPNQTTTPTGLWPFIKLLLATADLKTAPLAQRVLNGGRLLRSEAIALGVPELQQIKTNEEASDLMLALQVVASWAGRELLVWNIDELEYLDQLSNTQQGKAIEALKELWDRQVSFASEHKSVAHAPLAMVLAATPAFWQAKKAAISDPSRKVRGLTGLTPFFDRIPQQSVIEIASGLSAAESRELIVSRMKEARVGRGDETKIIPFTDDFVDYVFALSQGRPRQIIEICETIVAESARRRVPKITRQAAKTILSELLIAFEPDGDHPA